ncbi:hypothetical protein OAC87_04095 [Pseudomonadales bacterium]|nr:hypothetical protein [Pseudomonadales bacterium]
MAISTIDNNGVNLGQLGNRNMVTNGSMQVSQRYGYNSAQVDWNSYDASDRIFKRTSGGSTSSVQTRNDDAPSGFTYSDKLTITSQNSDTYIGRGTSLEWNDISHLRAGYSDAKTITLSFWVKASISGTYCFAYTSYVSSHSASDAATSYVTEYTVNSANTWEYKTITVTLPTSTPSNWDGSNGGNTTGLRLQWSVSRRATTNSYETATTDSWISGNYYCTSSQTNMGATNGSTFQITGVQLEVGDTATPFEHRSYGEELAKCQRYYEQNHAAFGIWCGGDNFRTSISFAVSKRANPTLSIIDSNGYHEHTNLAGYNGLSSINYFDTSLTGSDFRVVSSSNRGRSYGQPSKLGQNTISFDAEL